MATQAAPPQEEAGSNTLVRNSLVQVYQKSALVKYGVDSLEWLASQPALEPLVSKATQVTNPYLNLADERISQTVGTLQTQAGALKNRAGALQENVTENITNLKTKVSTLTIPDMYTLVDEAWFVRVNEILRELSARVEQTMEKTKVQVKDLYQSGKESLAERVADSPAEQLYKSAGRLYIDFALADRVAESQQFLHSMKMRMGERWNENLETPVREFLAKAKAQTLPELMRLFQMGENQRMNSLVGTSIGLFRYGQETVTSQWNTVMQATQDRVDNYLPAPEMVKDGDQESQPVTLRSLSRCLSKRVQSRALAKIGQVKVLSSERLRDMQHVDLVAYAETYLDGAKASAAPRLEQVAEQLQLVQSSLMLVQSSAVTQVQSSLEQAQILTQDAANNVLRNERVQELAEKIRTLLSEAVVQARSANLQDLPNQVATFFLSLPDQVMTVTPELNRLLSAIKSVLSRGVAPAEESDCCAAAEAVELGDSDELPVDATMGLLETPEEVLETPEVVLETPEVVLETPEVVLETPEVVLETPEEVLETPEEVLETPEVVLETPEEVLETPEEVLETPEVVLKTPEEVLDVEVTDLSTPAEPAVVPASKQTRGKKKKSRKSRK